VSELTQAVINSKIWQSALAIRDKDPYTNQRERLRSAFISFRERAGYLADMIRKDIPELTVHDLNHLDALWEISSMIMGDQYSLTPTEVFTLGGAILLHDLAMSVISIEGGYTAIIKDRRWVDLVISEYQNVYDRDPTQTEINNPESLVFKRVMFNYLRQVHGEKAERLAFISYSKADKPPLFLIEDIEIRQTFGRIIGLIAHSHCSSIDLVEKNFSRVIGAPSWCPPDWTIDPLKVSCALRLADAAHLDASRSPTFLKEITDLSPISELHWCFQEKLNKPYLRDDALTFTSGAAFKVTEEGAWWLCLEVLRMLDRELRSVDAMLAEKGYQRFAAKRVTGVDLPERLMSYVQTDGWRPINAIIHVTDLPAVIKSIGGEELYGRDPQVPLRELIQNGCDAVRARRLYEKREREYGKVTVSIIELAEGDFWLEVMDNGIGMSQRVMTDFLLDFGRTFWGSPQMLRIPLKTAA